jgi:hypothetical protein
VRSVIFRVLEDSTALTVQKEAPAEYFEAFQTTEWVPAVMGESMIVYTSDRRC